MRSRPFARVNAPVSQRSRPDGAAGDSSHGGAAGDSSHGGAAGDSSHGAAAVGWLDMQLVNYESVVATNDPKLGTRFTFGLF